MDNKRVTQKQTEKKNLTQCNFNKVSKLCMNRVKVTFFEVIKNFTIDRKERVKECGRPGL